MTEVWNHQLLLVGWCLRQGQGMGVSTWSCWVWSIQLGGSPNGGSTSHHWFQYSYALMTCMIRGYHHLRKHPYGICFYLHHGMICITIVHNHRTSVKWGGGNFSTPNPKSSKSLPSKSKTTASNHPTLPTDFPVFQPKICWKFSKKLGNLGICAR